MARRVFLSYPCDFPQHEKLTDVCNLLQESGCIIHIPPACGWTYYSAMEELIERVDTFIAVLDPIYDGSSQLLAHLHYADSLRRLRSGHLRPRIFGIWLGEPKHVNALAGYPLEILSRESYHLLLADSSPSG